MTSGKEVGWFVLIIMIFYCRLMVHITDTRTQKVVSYTSAKSLVQPFLYLFDAKTTTVEQISLFKLICGKSDG